MNAKEAFDFDFNLNKFSPKITQSLPLTDNTYYVTVNVEACMCFDFEANTKFIALYIPACPHPLGLIFHILRDPTPEKIIPISRQAFFGESPKGEPVKENLMKTAAFSGRIFIYGEFDFSAESLEELEAFSRSKTLSIKFRGTDYAENKEKTMTPLAFISHDSRDKDSIARPLVKELRRLGCPVWFDEYSLRIGDSLRESIEKGIKECKKCILVLSRHFLNNTGWTKTEFNAIFTKELIEGQKVILPVWNKITAKELFEYSPTLADKVAINWNKGRTEVAKQLYREITK